MRLWWWRWKYHHARDAVCQRIAWLMPKRLVMWCYVRVAAHATTGEYGNTVVPELGMMDALQRWPVQ